MDIDNVVLSPADYFSSPEHVTTAPGLDNEQKIRILESWKIDSMRLLTSAAENCGVTNTNKLPPIFSTLICY